MRLPLRNPSPWTGSVLAILLTFPCSTQAQRYDSMSATEVQRRLERDTDALVNELRSRRNTPLPSGSNFNINANPWLQQLRAREAEKQAAREAWLEKQRLDAQWARDHPGETREQYNERMDREQGAREAKRLQRLADQAAAQRAAFIARQDELLEAVQWADFRRSVGGFAARERPPVFTSGQDAVNWLIAHDAESPNAWAAFQAALLLMDGVNGVQRDPTAALRLIDPRQTHARPGEEPGRPETLALHHYLRATHPERVSQDESATLDARRELEKIAETSAPAKWLLARLLSTSHETADHPRSVSLTAQGYQWAVADYAPLFGDGTPLRRATLQHLTTLLVGILERHQRHLAVAQQHWTDRQFQQITHAVGSSPSASDDLFVAYTEAIAERAIPLSPETPFDNYHFGDVIAAAGRAGSATAHAIATLDRLGLLHTGRPPGKYKRPYDTLADMDLTIPALTTWARRDDRLGIRARLALAELANPAARTAGFVVPDSREGHAWADARHAASIAESTDYQAWQKNKAFVRPSETSKAAQARLAAAESAALAAFVARERSAPPVAAIPRLLANIEAAAAWENVLATFQPPSASSTSPQLAVDDPSFDLVQAAALLDAAFAPASTAGAVRNHYLYAAARLGDAYAPYALSIQPTYPGDATNRSDLQRISQKRRARDESAGLPRALLAKAVDALLRDQPASDLLEAAAQAGSALAAALQLDLRVGTEMAREVDRPPSWNLPPETIASLDAAVTALYAQPEAFADWTIVHALASPREVQHAARRWFDNLSFWDLDRQERIADAALAKAIQPQVDAVLAALADWPGTNTHDPRSDTETAAAEREGAQAQEAIASGDGLAALRHFLAAAGQGDHSALGRLSRHFREGNGGLPRSAALADQIQAAAFRMMIANAEAGDTYAAQMVGEGYLDGRHGAPADPLKASEWLRYAASIGSGTAAGTLAREGASALALSAAEVFYWETVQAALEQREHFLLPPRRLPGPRIDTTHLQAPLEAAVAAFSGFRNKKPEELSDAASEKRGDRLDAAQHALESDPVKGVALLAKVAADGDRYAVQELARILSAGAYGLAPAPDLARRFHTAVLGDIERTAAYGNEADAHRLACRALAGIDGERDIPTGIRWLTYAAERGNYLSALLLVRIYTEDVIPGIAPDPAEAGRWRTIADSIGEETYTPRPPLKR